MLKYKHIIIHLTEKLKFIQKPFIKKMVC
jgi:hypothetical protein